MRNLCGSNGCQAVAQLAMHSGTAKRAAAPSKAEHICSNSRYANVVQLLSLCAGSPFLTGHCCCQPPAIDDSGEQCKQQMSTLRKRPSHMHRRYAVATRDHSTPLQAKPSLSGESPSLTAPIIWASERSYQPSPTNDAKWRHQQYPQGPRAMPLEQTAPIVLCCRFEVANIACL
jgi:hypothetical protein